VLENSLSSENQIQTDNLENKKSLNPLKILGFGKKQNEKPSCSIFISMNYLTNHLIV
jgi:hypothetical protein